MRNAIWVSQFNYSGVRLLVIPYYQYSAISNCFRAHIELLNSPTLLYVYFIGTVRALGFLNERLLASGGAGDTKVRLVDVNKPTDVITSLVHGGQINEVYRCSENELVTASQDERIRIWDVRSSECVWEVSCVTPPSSVCCDKSEKKIATSCEDGTVQIFDRRNSVCFYSNKVSCVCCGNAEIL